MKRKLVLEFVFEEEPDKYDEEYIILTPKHVKLHKDTDLDPGELDSLGEHIAQTDRWQVDNWNAIQLVMSGQVTKAKLK